MLPAKHHYYLAMLLLIIYALYALKGINRQHNEHMDPEQTAKGGKLIPRKAFVIALDKDSVVELSQSINRTLQVNPQVIIADKGGKHKKNLHIFTRYMMDTGRVDHKLIGNLAMVGCLMSHVKIWRTLTEPAFIFEEDAVLDVFLTRDLMATIMYEASAHNWSTLMLTKKWDNKEGVTAISPHLTSCKSCNWYGTAAYIITPAGASILLEYHLPLLVQVDSLISLANTYDERFKLLRVNRDAVTVLPNRQSTIQTPCPKCYHIWDYLPW